MKNIDIIAGARPNFMKIEPVIHAVHRFNDFVHKSGALIFFNAEILTQGTLRFLSRCSKCLLNDRPIEKDTEILTLSTQKSFFSVVSEPSRRSPCWFF